MMGALIPQVLKNSEQLEINIDKVILGGTSAGANLVGLLFRIYLSYLFILT